MVYFFWRCWLQLILIAWSRALKVFWQKLVS